MEKSSYDLFCEHMQRYEAGERNLNKKEKKTSGILSINWKSISTFGI